MKILKYLLILCAVIPNVMATNNNNVKQQIQPATQMQSSTVVQPTVTQRNTTTKKLPKNIEKMIRTDLQQQLTALKKGLKDNKKNAYEYFAEAIYLAINNTYIGKKYINNVSEIEYLWNELLKPTVLNKRVKQQLQMQLDQYAQKNGITFRGKPVTNKELAKYSIDSLQTIIRFYRENILEKYEPMKNKYVNKLNSLYDALLKTTNYTEFFNIYYDLCDHINSTKPCYQFLLDVSNTDYNQMQSNILNYILEMRKANTDKIIKHFQKIQTTCKESMIQSNHIYNYIHEYAFPIFMYYLKKDIEDQTKPVDQVNNRWFHVAKEQLTKLFEVARNDDHPIYENHLYTTTYVVVDFQFIIAVMIDEDPSSNPNNNILLVNYINKYITTKIEQIKKYTAENKEDYKTACLVQLGLILDCMKNTKNWEKQYSNVTKLVLDNLAMQAEDIIKIYHIHEKNFSEFFRYCPIIYARNHYKLKKTYLHYFDTVALLAARDENSNEWTIS